MTRIPLATYRLQFTPEFTLDDAASVVDYLSDLGVGDIYASPIFKAKRASTHGYDVVDATVINDELGGEAAARRLADALRLRKMGWLQDVVPNHMAFDSDNSMLMDVLENGPNSAFVTFFDIDWDHVYESLQGRLLAPFLGSFYGEAIENGEISIAYDENGFSCNYYDIRFPLRIESYTTLLKHRLEALEQQLGPYDEQFIRYIGVVHAFDSLSDSRAPTQRTDQVGLAKRMLWDMYMKDSAVTEHIDRSIADFNGEKGNPASFERLDQLLSEQHFRLAFWKVATEEINYRRFFTINHLISLRVEDEVVFTHTHSLIKRLIEDNVFTGLRIDHIDGLSDPAEYLNRLRGMIGDEPYLVVEKILEPEEQLPEDWPIAGSTGYDFLNDVLRLQCDSGNEQLFSRIYSRFARLNEAYDSLVADKKRLIVLKHMAGNIDNLSHALKGMSSRDRHGNDITLYGLRTALVEVMAYFPVYRTYITATEYSDADREHVRTAIARARRHNPDLVYELDYLEAFLVLEHQDLTDEAARREALAFVTQFQQLTGPLMAKGFEDTTLYIYNRLLALNEVGGSPNHFGGSIESFHDVMEQRSQRMPQGMLTTATHDTKRGEDVRARLTVLSEIPERWEEMITTWRKLSGRKTVVDGASAPDRNDEYFLYQTLIGSWPFDRSELPSFRDRVKEYVIKAVREAKVHTAWLKPDDRYESAYLEFVDRLLHDHPENEFLQSLESFARDISWYGCINSLAQVAIKATAPGVPDFYQGCELWDLSMVDPDNRRPVDYDLRRNMLEELRQRLADRRSPAKELASKLTDAGNKMFVTHQVLDCRADHAVLFQDGGYIRLIADGQRGQSVVAFARRHESEWAITVVPRLPTRLATVGEPPIGADIWKDTKITLPGDAPRILRNRLTAQTYEHGGSLALGEVLADYPIAVLTGETNSD